MNKETLKKTLIVFHAMYLFEQNSGTAGYKTVEEIRLFVCNLNPHQDMPITTEDIEEIVLQDYTVGNFSIKTNESTGIKSYRLAAYWQS